jgi:hypothetical protein
MIKRKPWNIIKKFLKWIKKGYLLSDAKKKIKLLK